MNFNFAARDYALLLGIVALVAIGILLCAVNYLVMVPAQWGLDFAKTRTHGLVRFLLRVFVYLWIAVMLTLLTMVLVVLMAIVKYPFLV